MTGPEILKIVLRPRNFVLILIAAVALGILIERLIVTDAERINMILDDARSFALEGRWDEAVGLLDPDYDFQGMKREDIRKLVNEVMKGKPMKQFGYLSREVEVLEGGLAQASATVIMRGPTGMGFDDRAGGHFDLKFRKREDLGWVITAVHLVQ
jgi:hypothetical protein